MKRMELAEKDESDKPEWLRWLKARHAEFLREQSARNRGKKSEKLIKA